MKITEFSVRNYQFTLVMFVMVAVLGIATMLTMERAEDPTTTPAQYLITAVYQGTSPKDMEELIVKPIEKKVYELDKIQKITTNISDGLAVLNVQFYYGQDVDNKYQQVITEVNKLKAQLPKDINRLDVRKFDGTDVSIIQLALVSENESYKDLRKEADDLKDNLERIPELKKVEYAGVPEQNIVIDIQLAKLAQLKIPLSAVIANVQGEGVVIPGGNMNLGQNSFSVKSNEKFRQVEDVANVIAYNENGKIIYLKDIAAVTMKNEVEEHITRINGHRCVLVTAALKPGFNIAAAQKKYLPVITAFEKNLPANVKLVKSWDQAENVSHRLSSLGEDFVIAILLVLVTLLPLGFRASIVVMVAIPLSVALGIIGLNLMGYSLNQLSILGLVVALGLLVDDSIVVVENIERWLREGHSRKDAAIKATRQIGMAVLGCTATLIIAFLPLGFMPGLPGAFIRSLPVAIISCVLASMIVSLTVVPFLSSRLLKSNHNPNGNLFLRGMQKVIHGTYSRLMHKALAWPKSTLVIAALIFMISLRFFGVIGFRLFPSTEKPMFYINIKMSQQTNLAANDSITKAIEGILKRHKQITYFTSNVGKGNPMIYYNLIQQEAKTDFSQIFVQLQSETGPPAKRGLIDSLRQEFSVFPLAQVEVTDFDQGPPLEAPLSVRMFGPNLDTLRKLSFQVEDIIRSTKGTIYVNNELNDLKTDVRVNINKEKARTAGIMTNEIARTVRLAIAGEQVGSFTDEKGDDHPVIINAPRTKFSDLHSLDNLYINNVNGQPIALKQVATIGFETSTTAINHFNKNRFVKITALVQKKVLAENLLKTIIPQLDKLKLPQGYYYQLSGERESQGDVYGNGFQSVIIATLFLFIAILILQFKNFKGLLIVLSVIPLGIVGGVTALFLTGNPMSFIAMLGFIGLAGIEVKNSILLVDFTNQLRKDGVELIEAIEKAGEVRFLPVVLTSMTAIFGLLPLALNPNPQIAPLAQVLIGGLISSTILSRIVTPVMYKLIPPAVGQY